MRTVFLLVFLAVLAITQTASAETAVLFNGTAAPSEVKLGREQMAATTPVFPGFEVRFNDRGRMSFGVGYQRWKLEKGPVRKSFVVFRNDEPRTVSWDESADASGNVVLATLYVNLITRGKVRPFVGGGGGIGQFDLTRRIGNIDDTIPPFFTPGDHDSKSTVVEKIVKGVAGVNIYPAKHLVLSLGGGYVNGPALTLGAGFTF